MNRRRTARLGLLITLIAAGSALALVLRSHSAEQRREHAEAQLEKAGIEPAAELAKVNGNVAARIGAEGPHELARAAAAKRRLQRANASAVTPIPGTGGTWTPYGSGPLRSSPDYPAADGDGFGSVNGRINDFAYDPGSKTVYAAVAQGGVWKSTNLGDSWSPIGDRLPIASTGAIAYTKGRLIVATGDHAFSNDYAGAGVYWTTDGGRSWTKAKGAPDGALSYRLAVDPQNPSTVYYASGKGLFRSADAGTSFTNVSLPTGDCAGDSGKPNCFFANIVTDVAIQGSDAFGHKGGAVLAAVGWRSGRRPNFNNVPEAPANGLYRSDSGAPGSFSQIPDSAGFTPSERAGRIELGTASGPEQDSNYVYAIAQDSVLFNNAVSGGEQDVPLVGTPSVLDGIYVSGDFGKSWTKMESRQEFFNPANQSTLSQLTALGIAPGYQVTYNQWIKPDPLRADAGGVPTRLLFGMEEVWQSLTTSGLPQNGKSQFQVIGSYTANGSACLVVPEVCGAKQQATPDTTTTHPDQHAAIYIPDGSGGETLIVGNDGGAYKQHVDAGGEFSQGSWGKGANEGFHTLLPYGAAMSSDGTVYAGLQDNGQLKITPDGKQYATYVGDGTFALIEPDNPDVGYDELPNAGINVTTDGGRTYSDISPALTEADFVAPMVMDPKDKRHIMVTGRKLAEKHDGPDSANWDYPYDLGTAAHPGDAGATASATDPNNHGTALDLVGTNAYVGYCGSCDPVKLKQKFRNGLATDVGGTWHIAAHKGLPNRLITHVAMDPSSPKTVFVTLGQSAARYFAPLGSQGEDSADAAGGYVYKSTDGGESFTDITGDLPATQATWVLVRHGQLIVSDAVGIFASRTLDGKSWAPLGDTLPPVATYSMSLKPGDDSTLVAATYGRGVYTYRFADASPSAAGSCAVKGPSVKITSHRVRGRRAVVRGTSKRTTCPRPLGVKHVQVAVQRRVGKKQCRAVRRNGRVAGKAKLRCGRFYVNARGAKNWSFTSKRRLPRGRYRVFVRAYDTNGRRGKPRSVSVRVR
ncbi:MAG: hypothetical protein QOE86_57 [Solirubrobacteraceae bacterium]|nr:hypothetical protein [Solirubrobacteraceae bacterium]